MLRRSTATAFSFSSLLTSTCTTENLLFTQIYMKRAARQINLPTLSSILFYFTTPYFMLLEFEIFILLIIQAIVRVNTIRFLHTLQGNIYM